MTVGILTQQQKATQPQLARIVHDLRDGKSGQNIRPGDLVVADSGTYRVVADGARGLSLHLVRDETGKIFSCRGIDLEEIYDA